jgi:hypothetical protein
MKQLSFDFLGNHRDNTKEVFPLKKGQYVVAFRDMPVRGSNLRPTGETYKRRMEGIIEWIDNQDPPWLKIRHPDGTVHRICRTEIRVRYLHGKP